MVPHESGNLSVYQFGSGVDFLIRRVYCLTNLRAGTSRGFHAHRKLRQVAVCLAGSCRFVLDDGRVREDVVLNSPRQGLNIGALIWREMNDFSTDCVLMVLASEEYSEADYIRNYDDFLREAAR